MKDEWMDGWIYYWMDDTDDTNIINNALITITGSHNQKLKLVIKTSYYNWLH